MVVVGNTVGQDNCPEQELQLCQDMQAGRDHRQGPEPMMFITRSSGEEESSE